MSGTSSVGKGFFQRRDTTLSSHTHESLTDKRANTLAAVSNAAATAKRWGWNAIQRQAERNANGRKLSDPPLDLNQPMGRGQPLPPPGTPLPMPGQKVQPVTVPKKNPNPANASPRTDSIDEFQGERLAPPSQPALPPRRRRISEHWGHEMPEENDLVVEAPNESNPTTPLYDVPADFAAQWTEDTTEFASSDARRSPDDGQTLRALRSTPRKQKGHKSTGSSGSLRAPPLPARKSQEQENDEDGFSSWMDNANEPVTSKSRTVGA